MIEEQLETETKELKEELESLQQQHEDIMKQEEEERHQMDRDNRAKLGALLQELTTIEEANESLSLYSTLFFASFIHIHHSTSLVFCNESIHIHYQHIQLFCSHFCGLFFVHSLSTHSLLFCSNGNVKSVCTFFLVQSFYQLC